MFSIDILHTNWRLFEEESEDDLEVEPDNET
jgi:hypothetical protein